MLSTIVIVAMHTKHVSTIVIVAIHTKHVLSTIVIVAMHTKQKQPGAVKNVRGQSEAAMVSYQVSPRS